MSISLFLLSVGFSTVSAICMVSWRGASHFQPETSAGCKQTVVGGGGIKGTLAARVKARMVPTSCRQAAATGQGHQMGVGIASIDCRWVQHAENEVYHRS